ncbi:alpha/beta hydrolase [Leptolyngbya sp. FACHB-16]|uniref:alpha/beta fold hydrolase n=1 Tax=unclassified Leptolyngbya TaxID=2650499 RepID=UPI001687C42E|nr:alpha/beta hydrolase [Leptolyngbya sp. FACHB-16]MBD2153681.1 alpha/beta hydrolase [Leptolyngbya sp. FACHB-16]
MFYPSGFRLRRFTTTRGTLIGYEPDQTLATAGGNIASPPLLFLHGFGGGSSAYEWARVYPALVPEYSVLALDLLGWGRSEHLPRRYEAEDYLTTLSEVLDQSETPVTAIASSLTAALVIRLAIAEPHRFHSLFLVAPSGLSDFGEDYRRSPFAQLISTPLLDRLLYSTVLATPFGIRSFLEQRQFARANRISPEIVEAYLASAQQPNAEYSALSFVRGDLCFDLAECMPKLRVPTAIIWGSNSQFTDLELGRRLATLNPQAIRSFEVVEDCGLTPQLELPAVTIGLLRRWLHKL